VSLSYNFHQATPLSPASHAQAKKGATASPRLASPPALKRAPGHLLTTLLGTSSKIRQEEIILLWLSGCLLGIFFMFVAVN